MKKASLPIGPIIIVTIGILAGILMYYIVTGVISTGQSQQLSFANMFL